MIPLIVADEMRETLLDYLETTFAFRDEATADALRSFLLDPEHGIFRGPYVGVRLPFRRGGKTEAERLLDIAPTFRPYTHQLNSFARLTSKDGHEPQATLVTTGTGSGKTECFLYPILDHCLRAAGTPGVKALILYPMNALAEDQAQRIAEIIHNRPELKGYITAGLYVGGNGRNRAMGPRNVIDNKPMLRDHAPDILLTNYKMLDYLLLRQEDQGIWKGCENGSLRYLVLDELHSYDGAQGSDVACLVRRLRARLNAGPDDVCFVGTSATLANGADGRRELLEFARKLSGATVHDDAIVEEDRLGMGEFLDGVPRGDGYPADTADLSPTEHETAQSYLERQSELWFSRRLIDRVELGTAVREHALLPELLAAMASKTRALTLQELDAEIASRVPEIGGREMAARGRAIRSFLSLVSWSRRVSEEREEPLLQTQVQLWMRALSRLRRVVSEEPRFFWDDEGPAEPGLPAVYCRECGYTGWMTTLPAGGGEFEMDLSKITRSFFNNSRRLRYVFLAPDVKGGVFLDPNTMSTTDSAEVDGKPTVPILDPEDTRQETETGNDRRWCPECESDGALSLVASAGCSIASVAVAHLYASPFNHDKKLLAFTDSVQDACHRAGFFAARTYRFNLRTAIQTLLEAVGDLPLKGFEPKFRRFWVDGFLTEAKAENAIRPPSKQLRPEVVERAAGQRYVATFLPPDLAGIGEYARYVGEGKDQVKALDSTGRRLAWEVALEYGLNLRVGRTLDKTRCSTVWFDEGLLDKALVEVDDHMAEHSPFWAELAPELRRHFGVGLLMRCKRRGALLDPLVKDYVKKGGGWFHLSKRRERLMSPFERETPRPHMLTLAATHPEFDRLVSSGPGVSWYRDWATRCLGPDVDIATINNVYRDLLRALSATGLLEERATDRGPAWGIPLSALVVTRSIQSLRSGDGDDVALPVSEAPHWIGMPSMTYRGKGVYDVDPGRRQSYYQHVYQSGNVRRIHSHEHTGMLARLERFKVEQGFKNETRADSPNLLACTPTLEMGIDVGDLSSTMVCSIPPSPTNYLQRIGRAGRKTGNALILALANPTAHDLYFFSQPEEMLAGEVLPPGCYLDAPEMLKRQFTAFCLDWWSSVHGGVLPRSVGTMLSERAKGGFPKPFLDRLEPEKLDRLAGFVRLFRPHISSAGEERLRQWLVEGGMQGAFSRALDEVDLEISEIRRAYDRLQKSWRNLDEEFGRHHVDQERYDADKRDFAIESATLARRAKEVRRAYSLNLLVERSVLPNYNLPDGGVKLRMVVTGVEALEVGGKPGILTQEFARGCGPALRELAPGATFYVGGRKLPIDQIDTGGSTNSKIELWRFCQDCGHMALTSMAEGQRECPKCRSMTWEDVGQERKLLTLTRVTAKVNDADSRTHDEMDDREPNPFTTMMLFDIPDDGPEGGHLNDGASFGFEYLRNVTLREVNFGRAEIMGAGMTVAQERVPDTGFRICRDCGVHLSGNGVRHRGHCRLQDKTEDEAVETVFLYREMESEAIRFLLPVSTLEAEPRLANLQAGIELGIRRKFGGRADHLRLATMVMPGVGLGSGPRHYLVLYDSVAGGTGYLREFVKSPDSLLEVFKGALSVLERCPCQHRAGADGCYRCVYAYRHQREMPLLSRRLAIELVKQVLDAWPGLVPIGKLGDAGASDSLLESELEARFSRLLVEKADHVEDQIEDGKAVKLCKFGERHWRLEPQVDLGPSEGVSSYCRPDFILWPIGESPEIRPIAVFLDGYRYHVCPEARDSRLADDLKKRVAIAESGRFRVWTLVWDDIEQAGKPASSVGVGPMAAGPTWHKVAAFFGVADPTVLGKDAFTQLLALLTTGGTDDSTKLAQAAVSCWVGAQSCSVESADGAEESLLTGEQPALEVGGTGCQARLDATGLIRVLGRFTVAGGKPADVRVAAWLSDDEVERRGPSFMLAWKQFWAVHNIGGVLPDFRAAVGETTAGEVDATSTPRAVSTDLGLLSEEVRTFVVRASVAGAPAPTIRFELVDQSDEVIATADVAWADRKLAVFGVAGAEDVTAFVGAGWAVFRLPGDGDAAMAALEG